eukprot:TRINITY_DN8188_c0_g1_i1.p1 TRINITY_DN8188_c0_g1~~TRINITY_DN8188_c0_g1_i1.p1  ORF type:complete len:67 (+),score=3.28 TRINITY_DN8188_c0_g1_i1:349-549(+)
MSLFPTLRNINFPLYFQWLDFLHTTTPINHITVFENFTENGLWCVSALLASWDPGCHNAHAPKKHF